MFHIVYKNDIKDFFSKGENFYHNDIEDAIREFRLKYPKAIILSICSEYIINTITKELTEMQS